MSTGLDVFDATVQKTNQWLNEIQTSLDLATKDAAYAALRATLHALRDRIPPKEAVEFGSQLPMLVRGFYFEGFNPAHTPVTDRHKDEFLARVAAVYAQEEVDTERMVRAVFETVNHFVSAGQVDEIRHMLNDDYRDDLWPQPEADRA